MNNATKSFRPSPAPFHDFNQPDADDVIGSDKWSPSKETFKGFLVRDYQLATHNLQMAMRNQGTPMSFRDLKEQLLHSADTVELVLTTLFSTKKITENQGKYSLVG